MRNRLAKSFALLFLGSVFVSMLFTHINADEWIKTYEGGILHYVEQTKDNGYILLGEKRPSGFIWLVKTDSVGNTLWTRVYGDTVKWIGRCVQQTKDGGYIIAGEVYYARYALVIKTDSLGDTMWTRKFGSGIGQAGYRDGANCVQQTKDGGYVVLGETETYAPKVGFDVWLIKLDSLGTKEWWKTYGEQGGEEGYWIEKTYDNGYIIFGDAAWPPRPWLIKTDSLGDTLWTKMCKNSLQSPWYHGQQTSDSGYILTGNTYKNDIPFNGFLIKINSTGQTLWEMNFTRGDWEGGDTYPQCVVQTYDGGYAVIGWASYENWFLLKTNSSGDSLWTKMYEGHGDWVVQAQDSGYTMVGPLLSTGQTLIHTHASVGVEEESEKLKVESEKLKVYPNPAVKRLAIKYNAQKGIDAQLKLYDLSGRKIHEFKLENNQISWSIPEDLNSGCYFLTLKADSYKKTVKVLILK